MNKCFLSGTKLYFRSCELPDHSHQVWWH